MQVGRHAADLRACDCHRSGGYTLRRDRGEVRLCGSADTPQIPPDQGALARRFTLSGSTARYPGGLQRTRFLYSPAVGCPPSAMAGLNLAYFRTVAQVASSSSFSPELFATSHPKSRPFAETFTTNSTTPDSPLRAIGCVETCADSRPGLANSGSLGPPAKGSRAMSANLTSSIADTSRRSAISRRHRFSCSSAALDPVSVRRSTIDPGLRTTRSADLANACSTSVKVALKPRLTVEATIPSERELETASPPKK